MKKSSLIVVLAGLAALAALPSAALARNRMYDPTLGQFLQRDPVGTPNESPITRATSSPRFTQRDLVRPGMAFSRVRRQVSGASSSDSVPNHPIANYLSGMNLMSYVGARPVSYVDPRGLAQQNAAPDAKAGDSCECGPDITKAIVEHLTSYYQTAGAGSHSGISSEFIELTRAARANGHAGAFGTALSAYKGTCGKVEPCKGTVTFCGHCISAYHIDHLLIIVYIQKGEGSLVAELAGKSNESDGMKSPNQAVRDASRADLAINMAAISLGLSLMPVAGESGTIDDACASVEDIMKRDSLWQKAQMKEAKGGGKSYGTCVPCKDALETPTGLKMPE